MNIPPTTIPPSEVERRNIEAVLAVAHRIKPNPVKARNCRELHCGGKRGWTGVHIVEEPGKVRKYTLQICCGEAGSEADTIIKEIDGMIHRLADAMLQLHQDMDHNIQLHIMNRPRIPRR